MRTWRYFGFLVCCIAPSFWAFSQRNYAPHSVLSSASWFKLNIGSPGVYKMDIPFLNGLGVNTSSLSSGSVRLYGNGGQMLKEANNGSWTDDLQENAIQVVDGGDGIINGSDYILFYASGADEWLKDSVNQLFSHRKNIYNNRAWYFLKIEGSGKRILNAPLVSSPNLAVTSFSERYFYETELVNFLGSGKEWYGEEFANSPGKLLTRTFNVPLPNLLNNAPLLVKTNCVSRSVGSNSRFDLRINNQPAVPFLVGPVGGGQYDLFAQQSTALVTGTSIQNPASINFSYTPGSFNAQGWLNWFEVFTRRNLSLNGLSQLLFRDWPSVGNNRAEFIVSNATTATQVWDITDPLNPLRMQGVFNNSEFHFINDCSRLREYIAFTTTDFLVPAANGKISNQDLHNTIPADLIIVTHSSLLPQAQRLAQIHQQQNGLKTVVVTTDEVYNEFGSGSPDPAAIRDFVKMYYDRFGSSTGNKPKYLLLFGDGSFDYKDRLTNNTNLVPAYENDITLDPLSTYTSDDFYGFLDDNEDISSGVVTNLLDIGIGRVPAKNLQEAKNFVDKVAVYLSPQSLGPWRNNLTFLADDEDGNLHLQDAEIISATARSTAPVFNQQKIYLDAFQQETGPGGSHYPQAVQASNNQVYNGTLIWNFNGHGGPVRLAEETILDQEMINNWNNPNRLPLFITATCDFAPFDNPVINSIGENILLRPRTGAIALMTTTRLVFAFSNRIINNNYLQFALQPDINGKYKTLGEAVRVTKNFTYQNSGDIINNRKFTLLGDPALALGFPSLGVRATRINGIPVAQPDTLSAAEKINIEGEVTDQSGNLLANFNGNVYPTVFDKPQQVNTLANDPGSQVTNFQVQSNILFRGKVAVTNGRFSFVFKVPKDINYQYGNGKLSLYAEDGAQDGNGFFTGFVVGGAGNTIDADHQGPVIKPFLNDEKFVNGGLANQAPVLIVKLADSSGINTTGTGIGHDIVATLDNDNRKFFILNDFYEGELNSYQQGVVRFQLPELEPGTHTLKIIAWDVLNNSSEANLEFMVAKDEELEISHVLNYPNPFTSSTRFLFEHNKPGQLLQVQVQVMTITGRIIKTIRQDIVSSGNRSDMIQWDGRDDFGDKPGRGVYIYKLRVITPDQKKKEVWEKLVIL
ncbi:MAG: type IX secretion system sortase PorU [Chitinophagaceae bacterium]